MTLRDSSDRRPRMAPVHEVASPGPLAPAPGSDTIRVAALLGRPPKGDFEVVVRNPVGDPVGDPVVIRNAPLLGDGTPMPTRYWLVGADLRRRVDHLEAAGGVRRAEAEVAPDLVAAAHVRAARERDAAISESWGGLRPTGGVGGTRQGVKCLHAHLAWHLAGGDDPVGRWTAAQIADQSTAPIVEGVTGAGR
ncbi:MAG: DUF501 domain-containing protein [Actinomycetota bacterium]|nr:DUF501 domain-containing protein [Actinomycetota bacterium]